MTMVLGRRQHSFPSVITNMWNHAHACLCSFPLSDPDEHDVDPKTKKTKKNKKPSAKSGELKSQRSSKRLKTAA
ncbi:hypothetical protein MKW92_040569 [Papaver armeniacum]|nr:hypothetical protein MKW92_040569 [Papaver armeniacum]